MIAKNLIVNGLLVNYYFWPAKQNSASPLRAVVFLHGWRAEGRIWGPVARALSQAEPTIQAYAPDLPGFGKSGMPRGPFYLQDYAEAVREFIEKIGGKICLVGHSFGGRIAIKLASQNPQLISKLILVDSAGIRVRPPFAFFKKLVAKLLKPFFTPDFMQPWRRRIYQWLGAEDFVTTPELTRVFLNILNEDLTPLLPQIKIPTLIIWGEQDQETPLWMGKQLHSQIPGSRFEILASAGHFSFIDQLQEFVKILKQFLLET